MITFDPKSSFFVPNILSFSLPTLINHQNWQITMHPSREANPPLFSLLSPFGQIFETNTILIQGIDLDTITSLENAQTTEEKQKIVNLYLKKWFETPQKYHIHIEVFQGKYCVRIGNYGLQGGGKTEKLSAMALSTSQTLVGGLWICTGSSKGEILVRSGVSSLFDVVSTKEESFMLSDYAKNLCYSFLGVAISSSFETLSNESPIVAKLGYTMMSAGISRAITTTIKELIEKRRLPSGGKLLRSSCNAAICGAIGYGIDNSLGKYQIMHPDDDGTGVAVKWLVNCVSGVARGALTTVTSNIIQEKEDILEGVGKSITIECVTELFLFQFNSIHFYLEYDKLLIEKTKLLEVEYSIEADNLEEKLPNSVGEELKNLDKNIHSCLEAKNQVKELLSEVQSSLREIEIVRYKTKLAIEEIEKTSLYETAKEGGDVSLKKTLEHLRRNLRMYDLIEEKRQSQFKSCVELLDKTTKNLEANQLAKKIVEKFINQRQKYQIVDLHTQKITYQQQTEKLENILKGHRQDPFPSHHPSNEYLNEAQARIEEVLRKEMVQPAEQDEEELADHVILVHAIHQDNVFANFTDEQNEKVDWDQLEDPSYKTLVVLREVLTKHGVIGSCKDLEKQEYQKGLIKRPTIHWAWNQLVQPNSGGDWEGAKIAILEPMKSFEKSSSHKIFAPTPYDTETIGKHTLSSESTILVPKSIVDEVRSFLKDFPGKIKGFDFEKNMREIVFENLQQEYSEVWSVCDDNGELIGNKCLPSAGGYRTKTCLKRPNGRVEVLLQGEKKITSQAMKKLSERRYIGLHIHSYTFKLEDESNGYFTTLERFKNQGRDVVRGNPLFAGSIKNHEQLPEMGALSALRLYLVLMSEYESSTNSLILADYIINNAINADLQSLSPDNLDLAPIDLKLLIGSTRPYLINLLENIHNAAALRTVEQQAHAFMLFDLYKNILQGILRDYAVVSKNSLDILEILEEEKIELSPKEFPLCMKIAEEEWKNIMPPDHSQFDLALSWPLEDELSLFIEKIIRTVPADIDAIKQLYAQLQVIARDNAQDNKIVYRTNIIKNLIFWVLKEQAYLAIRGEFLSSLLASKAYRENSSISKYGLYDDDQTRRTGDCLFDNIAAQLEGFPSSNDLRKKLVEFMHEQSAVYSFLPDYESEDLLLFGDGRKTMIFSTWEEYLSCISIPTVWGTELEVGVFSDMLKAPIILLTDGKSPKAYNRNAPGEPLFIHHLQQNHFTSCIPFKGLTKREVFQTIIQGLIDLDEENSCSSIKQYFSKEKSLDGYETIETLKLFNELDVLYKKPAGVFEGYSVETHTKMVLDVLHHDFENREEFRLFLEKIALPFEQFKLFLSFHDIGKGKAVDEIPDPCKERKEMELRYTIEIIQKYSEKFEIDRRNIRIFEALLLDDFLGDYFLSDLSDIDVEKATYSVKKAAEHCGLSPKDMLQLHSFFHKIDASSYPGIRELYFKQVPGDKVFIGNVQVFKITGYCEAYDDMMSVLWNTI